MGRTATEETPKREMTPERTPEITVVIPTQDRCAELMVAGLPAALGQERVNHEVIVVDDGSTDRTSAVLAGLEERRLRVIRNDSPRGVAAARNQGIRAARADWIAFLDDDDLWSPRKLRDQLDACSGADFVYTGGVITDPSGIPLRDSPAPAPGTLPRQLARSNVIGGPSAVMVRRALLIRLGGFDERFSLLADWELWIRLAQAASPAACRRPLVAYREHDSNMSGIDIDEAYAELDALLERHGIDVDLAEFARWLAWQQRRVGRRLRAVRAYVRGAWRGRRGTLLLRAAATPLGEAVMAAPRRVRGMIGRPDPAPPSPAWIERYRAGLAAGAVPEA
jgi:glycosyltransferase involved in cell wall biosynthesis